MDIGGDKPQVPVILVCNLPIYPSKLLLNKIPDVIPAHRI